MNLLTSVLSSPKFTSLLLAAEESEVVTSKSFDLPETPWGWAILIGGFTLLILFTIWLYLRDTREMNFLTRSWLLLLRVGVIAALILIAINPQERTRTRSFRQSRVAILIDTSLSMRHPALDDSAVAGVESSDGTKSLGNSDETRRDAVKNFLANSEFVRNLMRQHQVSIFTFDSTLVGAHRVYDPLQAGEAITEDNFPNLTFWNETLEPRPVFSAESGLGGSLVELIEQVKGDQLSGIVVFTDGAHNAGKSPDEAHEAALESEVKLIAVGTGGTEEEKSLDIASVQAPTDVRYKDPYNIEVSVQGQGIGGRDVRVELMRKPENQAGAYDLAKSPDGTPHSRKLTLKPDGSSGKIDFELNEEFPGSIQYMVRVTTTEKIPGLEEDKKEYVTTVNIIERNTGVLIIAGGPMRDYRFVRNMLHRHPDWDVDVWLQSVLPTQNKGVAQDCDFLFTEFPDTFPRRPPIDQLPNFESLTPEQVRRKANEYDVVILFDPDWRSTGFSTDPLQRLVKIHKLTRWVSRQSGGLLIVAGDVYTAELAAVGDTVKPEEMIGFDTLDGEVKKDLREFQIADLYPVFLQTYIPDLDPGSGSETPFKVRFTPKGRAADFYQLAETAKQSAEDWDSWDGIYRVYPTAGKKSGATNYANHSDFSANTEHGLPIFLASQFYGSGRVFYIGSPEIWRLRAVSEMHYDKLWLKLLQDTGQGRRKMGSSQSIPIMDKNFLLRQMIQMRVRFQDQQGNPIAADEVDVKVKQPDGKMVTTPVKLKRSKSSGASLSDEYTGQFRATMPGQYRLEMQNPTDPQPLIVRVKVDAPRLEDVNRQQNVRLLQALVRDTGGEYYSLTEAISLETALSEEEPESSSSSPDPKKESEENAKEALSLSLPDRSREYWTDKQLQTLWDKQWVMYLLVALLSLEWLTRKLLKLA